MPATRLVWPRSRRRNAPGRASGRRPFRVAELGSPRAGSRWTVRLLVGTAYARSKQQTARDRPWAGIISRQAETTPSVLRAPSLSHEETASLVELGARAHPPHLQANGGP